MMKFRNGEELFGLLSEADDRYVRDAVSKVRRRNWRIVIPIVAATLALLLFVGGFSMRGLFGDGEGTGRYQPPGVTPSYPYNAALLDTFGIVNAVYPAVMQRPSDTEDYDALSEWHYARIKRQNAYYHLENRPLSFFERTIPVFLSGSEGGNAVYSPLNVYIALAMTAEITDGTSRAELLALLGEESMESLRRTASAVYAATYCDDGAVTCILASSLWLDKDLSYVEETVERIATTYYASSYSGEMGSEDYNEALRAWLNRETGGLLSDEIADLEMTPETVLALATTVYFKARWYTSFDASLNDERVFHGGSGDVLATFMNTTLMDSYYYGENFSSVSVNFDLGGGLDIYLPDEGVSVESLLSDGEVLSLMLDRTAYEQRKYVVINLSLPKFDVSSKSDLTAGLKELGVSSMFDASTADFSAIVTDPDAGAMAMGKIEHGARVVIDEEGCTAAAYTVELVCGSACPTDEVDFTVDRPFLFVIRSEIGLPLFVGIVNVLG